MPRNMLVYFSLASAIALAGCQEKPNAPPPPPEKLAASVTQVGATVTLRCYEFSVNNPTNKKLTDIHIQLVNGTGLLPGAPSGWQGSDTGGEVVFKTPPDSPGSTTSGGSPVPPGGSLGGFRFYLAGKTQSTGVTMSYDDGSTGPGGVVQYGNPVGDGGVVKRTGYLYCAHVRVTAPTGGDVSDMHFEGLTDLTPPAGWNVDNPGTGQVNIEVSGATPGQPATPALGGGQSIEFPLYVKGLYTDVKWKMTDAQHNDIPGANGKSMVAK